MSVKADYDWEVTNTSIEKKKIILERRRQEMLQLIPENSNNAADVSKEFIEEWIALLHERGQTEDQLIKQKNHQILIDNIVKLNSVLCAICELKDDLNSTFKQHIKSLNSSIIKFSLDNKIDLENQIQNVNETKETTDKGIQTSFRCTCAQKIDASVRKTSNHNLNKNSCVPTSIRDSEDSDEHSSSTKTETKILQKPVQLVKPTKFGENPKSYFHIHAGSQGDGNDTTTHVKRCNHDYSLNNTLGLNKPQGSLGGVLAPANRSVFPQKPKKLNEYYSESDRDSSHSDLSVD